MPGVGYRYCLGSIRRPIVNHTNASQRCVNGVTEVEQTGTQLKVAEQGKSVERRKQWSFPIGEDGSWSWRMVDPDGEEQASDRTFRTLKECTEDAMKNGYVAWQSESERRNAR
ncbi:MAG: hypothetical protein JWM26_1590 [Betaproteobacteria bacterium]|nr:hypothetical protein [Betaproteobacteria bacterium]